jgi:hypothetical protein
MIVIAVLHTLCVSYSAQTFYFVSASFGLGCKNTALRFFEQYLETSKAQTLAREIESKSARKSREETFFTQMSLLQNGKFTPNSGF